jgi:hypothetical protein
MTRSNQGERIAAVEQWQSDHEKRCEERLSEIKTKISRLEVASWSIVVGLLAWAMAQVWSGAEARIEKLERPSVTLDG